MVMEDGQGRRKAKGENLFGVKVAEWGGKRR